MSIPCDILSESAHGPKGLHDQHRTIGRPTVCLVTNRQSLDDPDISSLHNFIQNTQSLSKGSTSCKLVSSKHDIFAQTNGGAGRDRTDDPLLAKQVLSQLSYGPFGEGMVGLGGLEPPTSRLSSARSNQLSYKPCFDNRVPNTAR